MDLMDENPGPPFHTLSETPDGPKVTPEEGNEAEGRAADAVNVPASRSPLFTLHFHI